MHPAHVPFVMEAEPAALQVGAGRAAHGGKGGGFFGQRNGARPLHANGMVHQPQEGDRLQVFPAAMSVRHPLALAPAVVAVQHRSHGVHAQAIDTEMLQPVKRVAHQKIAHFGAAEVVDEGFPVLVKAFARIGVFVQCRAVKASQPMCIRGKVRRHPVQNDAQPGRVGGIDKVPEILWRAKARCRCIQTHRLVAPRAVKGVLADRHQFQMREAHIPGVGHQSGSQFAVAQPTPAIGLTPGP